MELSEKERLMLVKKKETICGLTLKTIEMANDPKNILNIKKSMTTILSELSAIASYSSHKNWDLDDFTKRVNSLFLLMSREKSRDLWILSPTAIEHVCNLANSVRFDFTKKGLKITFPKIDIGTIFKF